MRCPHCQHEDARVLDTRMPEPQTVKRRRQCSSCGFRFSTMERPVREEISVLKRSGRMEEFDRQKISASVQCALKKGNRRLEEVEALVEEILQNLFAEKPKCLSSQKIGEEVLRSLRRFDRLAYARYLSVHRTFADLKEFQRQIGESHGDTF
ncbi:MAG: hypothetical protein LBH53_01895 [Puniceicoccales bacterium]|jgi:transcriptional repressor NrdR|nr:hypothetical protein [Puniceicoccales bacterium]